MIMSRNVFTVICVFTMLLSILLGISIITLLDDIDYRRIFYFGLGIIAHFLFKNYSASYLDEQTSREKFFYWVYVFILSPIFLGFGICSFLKVKLKPIL